MNWQTIGIMYLVGGVFTIILCWIYDKIILTLQGFYDEQPMKIQGYLLILFTWPIVLVLRTLALPYHLWVAYDERKIRDR